MPALLSTPVGWADVMINTSNAEHYKWGDGCDGWLLVPRADLSVIHEKMPAKSCEKRHHHAKARQFFFVLSGTLTMEREGTIYRLHEHQGLEVGPMAKHQARNDSAHAVEFLVISHPTTRGDRVDSACTS